MACLGDHTVSTVPREGWAGMSDREVIERASPGFDALITGDRSLRHQQNLEDSTLTIIVLVARDNRVETIVDLAPAILSALHSAEAGAVVEVGGR